MGELARLASEPTEFQKSIWWPFIAIKEGPVLTGNKTFLWMGWCPLCDTERDDARLTAKFDFRRGLLYCDADEDGSCFDRRSMSLTNVLVRMNERG